MIKNNKNKSNIKLGAAWEMMAIIVTHHHHQPQEEIKQLRIWTITLIE